MKVCILLKKVKIKKKERKKDVPTPAIQITLITMKPHTVVEKPGSFWTPRVFVMYCITLTISLQSPSAVYSKMQWPAFPNMLHIQPVDVPCNTSRVQEIQEFSFTYFVLLTVNKPNNFNLPHSKCWMAVIGMDPDFIRVSERFFSPPSQYRS